MGNPYAKYALVIDLVLLATCALLLLIDIKIKNDLITSAMKLQESLDEQRRFESNGNLHPPIPGNLPDSDVPLHSPVEATDNPKTSGGTRKPRKRNSTPANGSARDADTGIPGASDTVGS